MCAGGLVNGCEDVLCKLWLDHLISVIRELCYGIWESYLICENLLAEGLFPKALDTNKKSTHVN